MAWKIVNLPMDLVEKLEAYMAANHIEVYWRAIEHLLAKEGKKHGARKITSEAPSPTNAGAGAEA